MFLCRAVYREDLQVLKKTLSKQDKEASSVARGATTVAKGVSSAASHGRRAALPDNGLSMQFIHG